MLSLQQGRKEAKGVLSLALVWLIPSPTNQETCFPVKISPERLKEVAASSKEKITKQIYKEYEESRKHNTIKERKQISGK